jgi:hypothetical protein
MVSDENVPVSFLEQRPTLPTVEGFARVAILMGYLDEPVQQSYQSILMAVCESLGADQRVERLEVPEISEEFSSDPWYWPHGSNTPKDVIISGSDGFNVFEFSSPIAFDVLIETEVADYEDADDLYIPDRYSVLWDGVFAIVSWMPVDLRDYPRKAGQSVVPLLEGVMERIGGHLYSQACSPECDFVFMHNTMEILESGGDDLFFTAGDGIAELNAYAGSGNELQEFNWNIYFDLNLRAHEFASVKNVGQRILDIEDSVRMDLDTLLGILYDLSLEIGSNAIKRMKRFKKSRDQRKRVAPIVARLWLQVVRMEALTARWTSESSSFENTIAKSSQNLLFAGEFEQDFASIRNINLELIREAIAEAAERLDNRAIIVATVMAALSGGVAGAIVAAIFH